MYELQHSTFPPCSARSDFGIAFGFISCNVSIKETHCSVRNIPEKLPDWHKTQNDAHRIKIVQNIQYIQREKLDFRLWYSSVDNYKKITFSWKEINMPQNSKVSILKLLNLLRSLLQSLQRAVTINRKITWGHPARVIVWKSLPIIDMFNKSNPKSQSHDT